MQTLSVLVSKDTESMRTESIGKLGYRINANFEYIGQLGYRINANFECIGEVRYSTYRLRVYR